MKTRLHYRYLAITGIVVTVASIFISLSSPAARAAEAGGPGLREKIQHLQQEAREMNAEGKPERAELLLRQAEELRAQARKQGGGADRPEREQPRPKELRRQIAQTRVALQEMRAEGRREEAMKTMRHLEELQAALNRLETPAFARMQSPGEPARVREAAVGQPELERLRHIEVAIDNLRAAGMVKAAERLEQQAQFMRQQLRAGDLPPGPPSRHEEEMERLSNEVRELREGINELRTRLNAMSREDR